jgi:hypothetical protein
LEKTIHHNPTKGGKKEGEKFKDWYSKTLDFYVHIFEQSPPSDIWLAPNKRFKEIHFQRVNTQQNWIIPKPQWLKHLWKFFKN